MSIYELVHAADCANTRLVCRPQMDTNRHDPDGRRVYQLWEECLSCGAETPMRFVLESAPAKDAA